MGLSARAIFDRALDLPPGERGRLVEELCATDRALRERVDDLLSRHDTAGNFLSGEPLQAVAAGAASRHPELERVGTRIGAYTILRLIGEGGFGSVYMAEQQEPVSRRVALKIIKAGMDTKAVIARFEAERQALAIMDHPNIAKVLDAGATESGRPYFVMEMVSGEPITAYCDRLGLGLRERLDLFLQVCDAAQHAHQKGIIHRDLKPSNVIVASREDRHHARVIDFGIAKATASAMTGHTFFTMHGQLVGTPEYMSPEQAEGSADIDTTTDVYSLGVLLYELLTGLTPFDRERFRSMTLTELQRTIREEEPPRPSSRLWRATAETHASRRVVADDASRHRTLRGDLDWIVMKAIDKERSRRYESAAAFAHDIKRHMSGEPVLAAPPEVTYRLRKFIRRHAHVSVVIGSSLLVLIGFAVYSGVQARRFARLAELERVSRFAADESRATATAAEDAARRERDEAVRAQRAESQQREVAERESTRAQKITAFLGQVLELGDPNIARTPDPTMRMALSAAAARVAEVFGDDPDSEATVRTVIGRAYANRGELEIAQEHLERALAIRREISRNDPVKLLDVLGVYTTVLEESSDPDTWRRRSEMWPVLGDVVTPTDPELGAVIASTVQSAPDPERRFADITRLADRTLELEDPLRLVYAQYLSSIADSHVHRGRHGLAGACLRAALDIYERMLPETDSRRVSAHGRLAHCLILDGRGEEASLHAQVALEQLERVLPPEHWRIALARARVAACVTDKDRIADGEATLEDCRARLIRARGATSFQARECQTYLVMIHEEQGREREAGEARMGLIAAVQGPEYWTSLRTLRPAFGAEHLPLYDSLLELESEVGAEPGATAQHVGRFLSLRRALLPDDHPLGAIVADRVAAWVQSYVNLRARTFDDNTDAMLEDAQRLARAAAGMNPHKRAGVFWWWGRHQMERASPETAEPLLREALEIEEDAAASDNYRHYLPLRKWLLGTCLLRQGRYEEAEPLLVAGFREQHDAMGMSNANTRAVLEDVLKLYRAWGMPDRAAEQYYVTTRKSYPLWAWDAWPRIRFIIETVDPRLALSMERVLEARYSDAGTLSVLVEEMCVARRSILRDDDPIAMIYIGEPWKWGEQSIYTGTPAWVWESVYEDAAVIFRTQMGDEYYTIANAKAQLSMCAISRKDYVAAQGLIVDAIGTLRERSPEGHRSTSYWKSMLASALLWQGHLQDAEENLIPSYAYVLHGYRVSHPYGVFVLSHVIDLYASTGRARAATEILDPYLAQVVETSNAEHLERWARLSARRPGLEKSVYAWALRIAEQAAKISPRDPDVLTWLGAAQYRTERYAEAHTTLKDVVGAPAQFEYARLAFRAMVSKRLGLEEEAAKHVASLVQLADSTVEGIDRENRALLAETRALIEGRDVSPWSALNGPPVPEPSRRLGPR